jgi:hypothetical protein
MLARSAATTGPAAAAAGARARVSAPRRLALARPARAAADDAAAPSTSSSGGGGGGDPAAPAPPMPGLAWPVDDETPKQVFAANGPLAERLNGRLAMLGFVAAALGERQEGATALAQLGGDVLGPLLLAVSLTLASVAPKIVSGTPLAELHAAATGANLRGEGVLGQALGLFDTSVELWTGRVAMMGLAGLVVVETVTGKAFF